MRPALERLRRIEAQLLGQPAPDWALQELLDPELAADTDLQRQLYQGIRQAGRQQLRRELSAIHEGLYGATGTLTARLLAQLRRLFTN